MYCDELNSLFLIFPRKKMPGMPALHSLPALKIFSFLANKMFNLKFNQTINILLYNASVLSELFSLFCQNNFQQKTKLQTLISTPADIQIDKISDVSAVLCSPRY